MRPRLFDFEPVNVTIYDVNYDRIAHAIDGLLDTTNASFAIRSDNSLAIRDVWFRNPATIVFWEDNTKTVVKTRGGEKFDPEKGLAMAIIKKLYGNNGSYYEIFKKWCPNE